MQTYGNKHVLQLKNVRETDFGNYSCMADNSLGRQRGSIEVSGEFFLLLLTDRTCESKEILERAFELKCHWFFTTFCLKELELFSLSTTNALRVIKIMVLLVF